MIAFDICARSISYLLCLISEFSSIIKIKSLLALPLMWHITSIFSKNHVQFLGTSAPWTYLEFQILLPAVWTDLVHCGMTCQLWKYIVSWLFSPNQALEWPIFPTSLLTLLWFLSYPIKTILTLGERTDHLVCCKMTSPSKPAVMDKVGLDGRLSTYFQCHPPSCSVP